MLISLAILSALCVGAALYIAVLLDQVDDLKYSLKETEESEEHFRQLLIKAKQKKANKN